MLHLDQWTNEPRWVRIIRCAGLVCTEKRAGLICNFLVSELDWCSEWAMNSRFKSIGSSSIGREMRRQERARGKLVPPAQQAQLLQLVDVWTSHPTWTFNSTRFNTFQLIYHFDTLISYCIWRAIHFEIFLLYFDHHRLRRANVRLGILASSSMINEKTLFFRWSFFFALDLFVLHFCLWLLPHIY